MKATLPARITPRWEMATLLGAGLLGFGGLAFTSVTPVLGFIAALVLATTILVGYRSLRRRSREVEIENGDLVIDGRRFPRTSMTSGVLLPPLDDRPRVSIDTTSTAIEILAGDDGEARQILTELGLDAGHHTARFGSTPPLRSLTALVMALSFVAFLGVFGVGMAVWKPLIPIAILLGLLPAIFAASSHVDIGTDGIHVKNRLDSRFHRWADVERVEPTARGLGLVTKQGRFEIPVTSYFTMQPAEVVQRDAMLKRIEEARSSRAEDPKAAVEALLDRGGRSIGEWLASLGPADAHEGFRDAATRIDDLRAVLEQPTSPWRRLGAAVVLARNEENRVHVRVAAEACADPKLRVALEAVADGKDDRAIEEAAAEIEETQQRAVAG